MEETDDPDRSEGVAPRFARRGRRASETTGPFRVAKQVEVDLAAFPIVRTTLPETVSAASIDALFEGLREAEARGVPYVHVYDATAVRTFEPTVVMNAIRMRSDETRQLGPSNCVGSACIAPSFFLRSVARTAFVFATAPVERQVFSTNAQATDWALARLGATRG